MLHLHTTLLVILTRPWARAFTILLLPAVYETRSIGVAVLG